MTCWRKTGWLTLVALVALLSLSESAQAQGLALDRYEPTPAGDATFAIDDPAVRGHLRPAASLRLSYAKSPLELASSDSNDTGEVVDHQLIGHLQLSFELFERLQFDLDLPATLSQGGEDPTIAGTNLQSPSGATFNDVRIGGQAQLVDQDGAAPAAALALRVWVPSGDSGDTGFTSSGEVRYEAAMLVGAEYDTFAWQARVGRKLQPAGNRLQDATGSEVSFGAGAQAKVGSFRVGPELYGATVANDQVSAFTTEGTHLEVLLGASYQVADFRFGGAAGPGLTDGIGTPTFRAILGVTWAPELDLAGKWSTDDGRGRFSFGASVDGAQDGGAGAGAAVDSDGDGVLDPDDGCPFVVGEKDPPGAKPGCPPDRDEDGFEDGVDKCPDEPGVASDEPARVGCPPDTDGDGIVDPKDACPREVGPVTQDPKTSGCPKSVRVEGKQIVILQQVQFATGSDVIERASYDLLGQVAGVLKSRPEIVRVAVDGHTDNVGAERSNLSLSRRRAAAVMRWLIEHGVDERRLEARGFGPRRPIASNDTDEGRAKNRRVEFQILKRSEAGRREWKDGSVDDEP